MEDTQNNDSDTGAKLHKMQAHTHEVIQKKKDSSFSVMLFLMGLVAVLIIYNQFTIMSVSGMFLTSGGTSGIVVTKSGIDVSPKGVPKIYGPELGVSYDDISPADPSLADATIAKMGSYDRSIQFSSMTQEQKQRYLDVALQISCEYCCGAEAIIFSNGEAACGCAHSQAMRGLAKYLIVNHGAEFTNDQILEELSKWKTLFFPGILAGKAEVLKKKGIELNYINLASNKYRGIETGQASSSSGGAMVGGC